MGGFCVVRLCVRPVCVMWGLVSGLGKKFRLQLATGTDSEKRFFFHLNRVLPSVCGCVEGPDYCPRLPAGYLPAFLGFQSLSISSVTSLHTRTVMNSGGGVCVW